jgi:hypothetical protein
MESRKGCQNADVLGSARPRFRVLKKVRSTRKQKNMKERALLVCVCV